MRSGLASGASLFGMEVLGYMGTCCVMLQLTLLQPHYTAGGACLCSDECLSSWCISAAFFLQKESSASQQWASCPSSGLSSMCTKPCDLCCRALQGSSVLQELTMALCRKILPSFKV